MKNKKGFIGLLMAILVFLLLVLVLGFVFFDKITEAMGSKYLIIAVILVLALVFHRIIILVITTIWVWVTSIINSLLK